MKRCPSCGTQYTDDTLVYCLQDGAPLGPDLASGPLSGSGETETVISSRSRSAPTTRLGVTPPSTVETRPSGRTGLVVAATALITVVVLGLAGLGIWLATRGGGPETLRVNNARPENSTINANTRPLASPTPSPSATPTVSPTQNIDKARITKDVRDQIDSWVDNTESFDADALMHNYADRVDYFRTGSATKQQIWEDKQRAFEKFDTIRFDISNVKIDVDPSGDTATAEFDKAWVFEGETTSKGKVRSQLRFRNFGGRWLITSEKDLKVY